MFQKYFIHFSNNADACVGHWNRADTAKVLVVTGCLRGKELTEHVVRAGRT